jgi:UPF0716 protein FxsA
MQLGLLLLCLAFPLLEIAVLIKVGGLIGFWWTVALLIGMCAGGSLILRQQGFAALNRAMQATREGRPPIEPVVDSAFLMLAGVLLLIPGLLTDVAGLLLLIRPLRMGFARWVLGRMMAGGTFTVNGQVFRSSEQRGAEHGEPDIKAPPRPSAGAPHAARPGTPHPGGPHPGAPRPGGGPRPSKAVVIDGEWEKIDETTKRPNGTPPRPT